MKRAIVIGATSGIGLEVAKLLLARGWALGVAGRREAELERLRTLAPERVTTQMLDVTRDDAPERLHRLIEAMGGMELFFLSSGVGRQNTTLQEDIELWTAATNVSGFIRMVTAAYRYFHDNGGGHIAVISSIAGTKGLGSAPAYSASKRFQNTYIDALAQLTHLKQDNLIFTDIRPGFVDTAILDKQKKYPMLMRPEVVARHIVRAIEKRKRVVVIDWRYRLLVFFLRLVPQRIWERLKISNN
ncbi:SDR family oxidoreductase [Tannerella sp.]|uniref:SDR family NAD(P)-dependent oxidoreductase n=1 Tax=Tannerella sp. TaxID=2382127 RepID=UPI0026DC865A|nr:SDR family NAD(P)-dependent oxidoreductase [Tannerella sp.]MDO4703567.1 SDR family NAD(P)-dependent oxidoreductase [Tannerella sp.]